MEVESYPRSLFLSADFSDARVIVEYEDTTKCILPVHSLVLKQRSPVFRMMLEGNFVEGKEQEIVITDFKAFHVRLFLEFLYMGTLPEICMYAHTTLCSLARLANKYMVSNLQKTCENSLSNMISVQNIYTLLSSSFPEMSYLKEFHCRCMFLFKRAAFKLLKCEELECLSEEVMGDLVSADNLRVSSEMEVFWAIWRWGNSKIRFTGLEVSNENITQCIKGLIKHVRWSRIDSKDQEKILGLGITVADSDLQKQWEPRQPSTTDVLWFLGHCDILRVDNCSTSCMINDQCGTYIHQTQNLLSMASLSDFPFYVVGVVFGCMQYPKDAKLICSCESSLSVAETPTPFQIALTISDHPTTYYQEAVYEFPQPILVCKDQKLTMKIVHFSPLGSVRLKLESNIIESNKGRKLFVHGEVFGIRQIFIL